MQLGFGVWRQQLRINVKLRRRWQYYVYRVIFVLGLVTLASCFTCFIPSDSIDGQLGYLSACLLACVAYLYVVGEALPKLPFLTILDIYTFSCILYVGVLMIKACILSFLGLGLRENAHEILVIFAVDLLIWIAIHVAFSVKSLMAKRKSDARLQQFPGSILNYSQGTAAIATGMKVESASGDCVAELNNSCKDPEMGEEVYHTELPPNCDVAKKHDLSSTFAAFQEKSSKNCFNHNVIGCKYTQNSIFLFSTQLQIFISISQREGSKL